ncbi:TPA: hypothetical protein R4S89_003085 [Enterobacter hormaechei subsp. steigerwaltii]|nr:hypothetical protein [Enterobacter hormaechei subsp. steigerwaltii]
MSKETVIENKSTELFYDLACRSFTASWNLFMEVGNAVNLLITILICSHSILVTSG